MRMYIMNAEGQKFLFTIVETVDEGQAVWRRLAKVHINTELIGFSIEGEANEKWYEGNYVTDEC